MKVFLDANILVSVLNKEYPLFTHSSRILSLIENVDFTVYTSPLCLAIAYYFSEKKSGRTLANKKMALLCEKIKITTVDQKCALNTIGDKSIHDFEDGLEYFSAIAAECDCIISEDRDDFYFSKIEILSSKSFLGKHVF
ncbi:MAG TPA: PIN domain-containing protein [Fulvivirga sp.]|nr:PIN domain-containing protein [Fulvivirga sp.]